MGTPGPPSYAPDLHVPGPKSASLFPFESASQQSKLFLYQTQQS